MLTQCDKNINKDQIRELQKYKQNFEKFNYNQEGYKQLVDINLS